MATHKQIDVLGILAVASNTHHWEWARVDVSVDRNGNLTEYGVDKFGLPDGEIGIISSTTFFPVNLVGLLCDAEIHLPPNSFVKSSIVRFAYSSPSVTKTTLRLI